MSGSRVTIALLYMSTTPPTLMFYHVNADPTNFSFEVCLMFLIVAKRFLKFSSQITVFLHITNSWIHSSTVQACRYNNESGLVLIAYPSMILCPSEK